MVDSYNTDAYCGKNWASFFAYHACFHGDWRGWFICIFFYIILIFISILILQKRRKSQLDE